ncbi:16S rRNA processing protein RimM [Erythrobacter sp. SCSIO 43205]|uniref:ribosome maturation factor RimM n=1 Tax=Erythrobacter sp. SCSIO 43205 TaxID=2779361 RepID=UPI001CA91269|nr:ribosome maturation factor RimM [Erythrobacter sp. SCSIO 43205]UAB77372.1 16S rRNA processing protein RimM [Erythrobacter sp. SCSIO 43205]
MSSNEPIVLAAVTGAHGVAGEVRLKLLGEGLEALKAHKSFNSGELTLKKIRSDNKGGAVARFAEVNGRNAAEKLRGTTLSVPREELPQLAEDEYYHADLIGLEAQTDTGRVIGTVAAVQNYGATDIVEITLDPPPAKGMKTLLVPMTRQAVIEWDEQKLVIAQDFADQ